MWNFRAYSGPPALTLPWADTVQWRWLCFYKEKLRSADKPYLQIYIYFRHKRDIVIPASHKNKYTCFNDIPVQVWGSLMGMSPIKNNPNSPKHWTSPLPRLAINLQLCPTSFHVYRNYRRTKGNLVVSLLLSGKFPISGVFSIL